MSEHLVVYAVIDDYEKDIACAALTQKEAEEIIRESEDGEEAYHVDNVYLFGEGILTGALLAELTTLLETQKSSYPQYPHVKKLVDYLADQPYIRKAARKATRRKSVKKT